MTRLFERAIQRALLYIATMSGPLEQVEETIEEIHQEGPYRTAQPNQGDIEADRKAVSKICEEEKRDQALERMFSNIDIMDQPLMVRELPTVTMAYTGRMRMGRGSNPCNSYCSSEPSKVNVALTANPALGRIECNAEVNCKSSFEIRRGSKIGTEY